MQLLLPPSSLGGQHHLTQSRTGSYRLRKVSCATAAFDASSSTEDRARQAAKEVAAAGGSKASQTAAAVEATIDQSLPEAEKERLRRERISQANKGRTTWNKGRKHKPETIAKIKARTAEAMMRQEVVDAYKASMQPILEEKRIQAEARKAKQKEEKEKAAAAAKAAREAAKAAAKEAAAAERAKNPPKPRAKPKPKPPTELREGETSNGEASTSAPKQRARYSEEHRRKISEAIRAKWQDQEYRARAVAAIQQERQNRDPSLVTRTPRTRSSSSSSSGGSGAARKRAPAGAKSKQPTREQIFKEKLNQLQILVKHIIQSQDLVARTDMQLEATKLKVQAFENDPHMAAKAQGVVANVETMLTSMRAKLEDLTSQLPPGTRFDRQGNVGFSSPDAAAALLQWSIPSRDGGPPGSSNGSSNSNSGARAAFGPGSPSPTTFSNGRASVGATAAAGQGMFAGASSPSRPTTPNSPPPPSFSANGLPGHSPWPAHSPPAHHASTTSGANGNSSISGSDGENGDGSSPGSSSPSPISPSRGTHGATGHHVWVNGLEAMGANPKDLPPGHPAVTAELAARAAAASPARRALLQGYLTGSNSSNSSSSRAGEEGSNGGGVVGDEGDLVSRAELNGSGSSSEGGGMTGEGWQLGIEGVLQGDGERTWPPQQQQLPSQEGSLPFISSSRPARNPPSGSSSRNRGKVAVSSSEEPHVTAPEPMDFTPSTRTRRVRRGQ